MIIDAAIQALPFIALATPDIAPVAPAYFKPTLLPDDSLLLEASGTADPAKQKYPGVLFCPGANGRATPRPILPNTGNMAHSFEVCVSGNGHVLETDVKIVQGGLMFDGSLQRVLATGEIDLGAKWVDSGISHLGALAPGWHKTRVAYALTAKAIQVVSYECDGIVHPIAPAVGTFAATPSTWLSAAYPQLQIGLFPTGDQAAAMYRNQQFEWW
jgi:hypothetical protein